MDEPQSNSPGKQQAGMLIIDGNPEVGGPLIFGRGVHFYMFYYFFMLIICQRIFRRIS